MGEQDMLKRAFDNQAEPGMDKSIKAGEKLFDEVNKDDLTGLLNRKAIMRELHKQIETSDGNNIGFIFIDLKDFKKINDTAGHEAGNQVLRDTAGLLKEFAELLQRNVRPSDLIANDPHYESDADKSVGRLGGDEFAILVDLTPRETSESDESMSAEDRLSAITNRIRQAYSENAALTATGVGISIGGAVHQAGETAEQLAKRADDSMYDDKNSQKAEQGSYR